MPTSNRVTLRTRAKQIADLENSNYIIDDEWNYYINNSASELFDIIVHGDSLTLQTVFDQSVTAGTNIYNLPADFAKLIAVYWMDTDKPTFPLRKASMHEFGYQQGFEIALVTGRPYAYNILSNQLWLYPLPNMAGKVRIIYYPDFAPLTSDLSTFGWPILNGWEEFIVVSAAIMALTKEESDTTALQLRKTELKDRIKRSVATKDQFEGMSVRDRTGSTFRHRRFRLDI